MDRLSRKEIAAQWGVSTQRVDALVKEGRLVPGADKKFDPDEVAALRASFSPQHVMKEQAQKAAGGAADPRHAQFVQARTMDAVFKAKTRELQFKREQGVLVERAAVEAEGFEIGRILQQRIMAWPARMAAELSTLAALPDSKRTAAIRAALDREARVLVEEVAGELKTLKVKTDG